MMRKESGSGFWGAEDEEVRMTVTLHASLHRLGSGSLELTVVVVSYPVSCPFTLQGNKCQEAEYCQQRNVATTRRPHACHPPLSAPFLVGLLSPNEKASVLMPILKCKKGKNSLISSTEERCSLFAPEKERRQG